MEDSTILQQSILEVLLAVENFGSINSNVCSSLLPLRDILSQHFNEPIKE